MAHGPYWADLPVDTAGKHYVSPAMWDLAMTNIITFQSNRNANNFGISNLGALTFASAGVIVDICRIQKSASTIGPVLVLDNPSGGPIGSGVSVKHFASTERGSIDFVINSAPYGSDFLFKSAGNVVMQVKTGGAGVAIFSAAGAGSGISPVLDLQNSATNVGDGVEIRHTAGTIRGCIRMQIGDSPFGTDFILVSNNTTMFRVNSNGRIYLSCPASSTGVPAGLTAGEIWHDLTTNAIRRVP